MKHLSDVINDNKIEVISLLKELNKTEVVFDDENKVDKPCILFWFDDEKIYWEIEKVKLCEDDKFELYTFIEGKEYIISEDDCINYSINKVYFAIYNYILALRDDKKNNEKYTYIIPEVIEIDDIMAKKLKDVIDKCF